MGVQIIMATNKKSEINLANVRSEFKELKGTPSFCVKQVYAAIDSMPYVKKMMPAKADALSATKQMCEVMGVGTQKTIKRTIKGCDTTIQYTVKCSVDMVLRFFLKVYKGEITLTKETTKQTEKVTAEKAA